MRAARGGRVRVRGAHDDEHVLEVRAERGHVERQRARLLEHDGDHVVADVSLALQLLPVRRRERQQRRHVEHELDAQLRAADAAVLRRRRRGRRRRCGSTRPPRQAREHRVRASRVSCTHINITYSYAHCTLDVLQFEAGFRPSDKNIPYSYS